MKSMTFDINGLGRFIIHKGIPIRTPCKIETSSKDEIDFLKSYLESNCIKYSLYPTVQIEQKKDEIIEDKQDIQKEKPKKEPITILDKLAENETIEGLNNEEN